MLKLVYVLAALLGLLLLALLAAWLWLRAPDLPAADLEARHSGPQDHFIELAGGLRLHYRDQGEPQAPVLLLLHGYGDSYASWEAWAQLLQPGYRVISLDLPGHGLTAAPSDYRLDADALAALVRDFAQALKLPPYVVAGNSMGGGVAWKLALLAPEQLRGLVLVGPHAGRCADAHRARARAGALPGPGARDLGAGLQSARRRTAGPFRSPPDTPQRLMDEQDELNTARRAGPAAAARQH